MSGRRRASDVFVDCLEAEGVRYVFGIPGEETLDLNDSLASSSISFIPVRHEQGGAYMADMYGRLTGRAGVCLGTLGPGAMNLVTAIGDAFLDRAPVVALTGQADLERMHKESHQFIDLVDLFRPITKWNARVTSPEIVPEVVRKAFKVAESEKPGATMLELPEDVMAAEVEDLQPLRRRRPVRPEPAARELLTAADLIRNAISPVLLAGNGVVRAGAAPALREFCRATGIAVAETFMGKGVVDAFDPHALGTVGLHDRDYAMAGFEDADLVVAVGYDLVEHAPSHWNPRRDKKIVVVDSQPAEIDEYFQPEVELVGDIYHVLSRLAEECRDVPHSGGSHRLREVILGRLEAAREDTAFPMQPPRALWEIRQALGREDILISDVGLHKLWIGRMFPAHEPNTVLIANGLAGMGFAVPCAVAAKLVHPERKVVTVNGDGGFLMNCQELETAVRLRTPIVNVIWENEQYGSIVWKQEKRFGRHFGTDFTNPDFVRLAESFGMPAFRCEKVDD
ncbi:MAG: acetolactate synthase large subunit, partial [Solirubrobacteraceae bacterium]|nr:acetolactate synthase large subunit [Solirubrobacteraceae bacterium]